MELSPCSFRLRIRWVRTGLAFVLAPLAWGVATNMVAAAPTHSAGRPLRNRCQSDPSALIAALPAGSTFHGTGCYTVRNGIVIDTPDITIDGGFYYDPTMRGHSIQPIIKILQVSGTTIENVVLAGANVTGGIHAKLVGEAGIKTESSSNTTIANVVTSDTFGDGLELWFAGPHHPATTDTTVNGLTIIHAGRLGVTPAFVYGLSMNGVNVVSSAGPGIDFESDFAGIGSGYVAISNSTFQFVNLIESWSGPITFTDCALRGHIVVGNAPGRITINGGSLMIPREMHGTPSAGIQMTSPKTGATGPSAVLTLNGVTITRDGPTIYQPDAPYLGPNWDVGSHQTLILKQFAGPTRHSRHHHRQRRRGDQVVRDPRGAGDHPRWPARPASSEVRPVRVRPRISHRGCRSLRIPATEQALPVATGTATTSHTVLCRRSNRRRPHGHSAQPVDWRRRGG